MSRRRRPSSDNLKVVVDLDDPDILPLKDWLAILKRIRVKHELERDGRPAAAARRLGVSRYTVYRNAELT